MSIILPVRRDAEPKSWYSQANQPDVHVTLKEVAPYLIMGRLNCAKNKQQMTSTPPLHVERK